MKRKIAPSEIEGSVSFPPSTKVDEDSLVRNVFVSALLRGKARTVKENRGEKTKEHFDNEVLLEQKLFSSTQFHPTFNNLPVLKPIPKNRSLQFIYILLSKHFYLNSLLPIISIYSSVPFLSKRRHFSRLVAKSKPRKPKNTRIEGKNLGRKQQVSQREPFIN